MAGGHVEQQPSLHGPALLETLVQGRGEPVRAAGVGVVVGAEKASGHIDLWISASKASVPWSLQRCNSPTIGAREVGHPKHPDRPPYPKALKP
jgi:hypothetical protein